MGDVLLRERPQLSAVLLEAWWHETMAKGSFELLCGYGLSSFGSAAQTETFDAICARHGTVLPSERYAGLDGNQRLRALATLEQRATALAREIESATRARDEILAIVSHDLKNPLSAILLACKTLGDTSEGALQKKQKTIGNAAERMARLIDDLVDFASIQSGHLSIDPRPCAPGDIVAAATDMFAGLAEGRGVEIVARVEADLPRLLVDRDRAVQALANLVSNAVKITPPGGRVTVAASRRESAIEFSVDDTGPGIPPDELPKLFELYWRGEKTEYKGTGLGLGIAKSIVVAHDGRIGAESTVGAGSRFWITLPLPSQG
jgi:signal transduction histidine kinase